jgi:2,3-dihydroxybenzoate decarboxylase
LSEVPELEKATWEWTTETATHALRLIMTVVFDRYPRVQVIRGHMGETLPHMLWRLDSRYRFTLTNRRVKRNPSEYIRDNFLVTTSGQFSDVPLHAALAAMGPHRVMFSIDYPYESSTAAGRFMDSAAIPENTRTLVGHENAKALLKPSFDNPSFATAICFRHAVPKRSQKRGRIGQKRRVDGSAGSHCRLRGDRSRHCYRYAWA